MRAARLILIGGAVVSLAILGQRPQAGKAASGRPTLEDLRKGVGFIPTPVFSAEQDKRLLALFEGLRVADVSDGMDSVGLHGVGRVDPAVHALWRDTRKFTHRIVGIAVTARYVPARQPPHPGGEGFDAWVGASYRERTPEPFVPLLRPGTCLVIEEAVGLDVGSIGSNNIMGWRLRGCVGVVTNGTARDTDEIITERIPLYFRGPGRGIRPGRNEIESVNRPVVIGGVTVVPGDVVVADGDGVVVVPRPYAERVARYARRVLKSDKAARKALYRRLGIPEDESVK